MRPSRPVLVFVLMGALIVGVGCGKRGNPQAPLRPVPAAVGSLTARRTADRVELRFTIPAENADRSAPPAVTRVDIYAAAGPPAAVPVMIPVASLSFPVASVPLPVSRFPAVVLSQPAGFTARAARVPEGPPVTAAAILKPKYLRGHVDVRPPPAPPPPGTPAPAAAPADPRPAPGDVAVYVEQIPKELAAAAASRDVSALRFVVVGVAGHNRPGVRALVEIPLGVDPAAPHDPAIVYDETSMKLTWTPSEPGQKFHVYRSDSTGQEQGSALNAAPLTAAEYSAPVEFGVERCFLVRAAVVTGAASVESVPAGPVCKTPVDTFPPPTPTGLSPLPSENKIALQWTAVMAADLAGYIVLRAEGPDAPLQPLMQTPIAEPNYTDTTTKVGVRYRYVVVALDKAGNRSEPSTPVEGVGR